MKLQLQRDPNDRKYEYYIKSNVKFNAYLFSKIYRGKLLT